MKILFWPELSPSLWEMAKEFGLPGMELESLARTADDAEVIDRINNVDCLFSYGARPMADALYQPLGQLKLFQLLSAGYDFLDIENARTQNLVVCNNGGANAIAVAEHTVLLILAVLRKLTVREAALREGRAERDPMECFELAGRTVGLVGLGAIGREVAQRLSGFNVTLRYYDVVLAKKETETALNIEYRSLPELLAESDVVSLHVPLDDQKRKVMNAETIKMMKPGSILINTARGELIDEEALAVALSSGSILGAGLDVFTTEPPPVDHPLLNRDLRVIATPHSAGPTWESFPRRMKNAFANAERVQRGEAPLWLIPELR